MKHASLSLIFPLVCGASLGAAQPAAAPSPALETLAEVSGKAREARLKRDVPAWRELANRSLALAPDHPDILISAARANAAAGDEAKSLDLLAQAVRRGAGLDPVRFAEFKSLAASPQFQGITADARRNLVPMPKAVTFADLSDQDSEGITFDPVSRRFFAGTQDGKLLAIGMDGKVSTFASGGGLRQMLGLKVDAARRLLWVVNGRYPEPGAPADAGTGGVRAYNLDSGTLVTSVELDERPVLHGFNDMALAPDGRVYVTDSATHAVYTLAAGARELKLLLRDSRMTFPNGIVLAPDGRTLYVAHVEGISALDLATKTRSLLPVSADGSVNSIDGLLLHDGVLYGVQNSPYMHRIVGAALAADGRSIARVWTVNSRTPAEYLSTTAAIADGYLFVIGGTPMPDVYGGTNPAKPTRKIWRMPLKR